MRVAAIPLILAAVGLAAGCTPTVTGLGAPAGEPVLAADHVQTADGSRLPLRVWRPDGPPRAVIVALHGFADHSNGFASPASHWAERGILTYAYDQRGFGATETRGMWPGDEALTDDFGAIVRLVRARHPGVPIHALGVSMGAAVILTAMGSADPPDVDGVILSSAAVTGGGGVAWWERGGLWLAAHLIPWATVTGEGANTHLSDNIEMIRELARDPLVMKKARIDTVYGLLRMSDAIVAAAPRMPVPALVLFGDKEDIVRRRGREALLAALPPEGEWRLAEYAGGYHLLLRDRNARLVLDDIVAWIGDSLAPLPSGAERPDRRLRPPAGGG